MENRDQLYCFLGLVLRLKRSCRKCLNLRGVIAVILSYIGPLLYHFILVDWNGWVIKLLH
jgi:hypothetical protein